MLSTKTKELLNYFFSLHPDARAKFIVYLHSSLIFIAAIIICTYLWCLHLLQSNLNSAVANVQELTRLASPYMHAQTQFIKLSADLTKNNRYADIANVLEQKTKEFDLTYSPIANNAPLIALTDSDPFFAKFQKVNFTYRIESISLKKTIDYLSALAKMENRFLIKKAQIQQRLGTKLYFTLDLIVEAYVQP